MQTDNSKEIFEEMKASGVLNRLSELVYQAFLYLGPVHNHRLLEYLQQKEAVNKKKADRIEWTAQNCWPRVTELVSKGCIVDMGAFRGPWLGKVKTLHLRYAAGDLRQPDEHWDPLPRKRKIIDRRLQSTEIQKQQQKATETARSIASQAGHNLQACRKRKKNVNPRQKQLF